MLWTPPSGRGVNLVENREGRLGHGDLRVTTMDLGSCHDEPPPLPDDPGPGNHDTPDDRLEKIDLHFRGRARTADHFGNAVAESRVGETERDAAMHDPGDVEVLVAHRKTHRRAIFVQSDNLNADGLVKPVRLQWQEPVSRISRTAAV